MQTNMWVKLTMTFNHAIQQDESCSQTIFKHGPHSQSCSISTAVLQYSIYILYEIMNIQRFIGYAIKMMLSIEYDF